MNLAEEAIERNRIAALPYGAIAARMACDMICPGCGCPMKNQLNYKGCQCVNAHCKLDGIVYEFPAVLLTRVK